MKSLRYLRRRTPESRRTFDVTGFSTEGDELAGVLNRIHSDGVKTTEESVRMAGANYVAPHPPFDAFMVASGRVVTGANPASAHITSVAAIEAFDKVAQRATASVR